MKRINVKFSLLKGPFQCECGSWNTGQTDKTDYCNDCGWYQWYP